MFQRSPSTTRGAGRSAGVPLEWVRGLALLLPRVQCLNWRNRGGSRDAASACANNMMNVQDRFTHATALASSSL